MRLRHLGIERNGTMEMRQSLLGPFQPIQEVPQMQMRIPEAVIRSDDSFVFRDGLVVLVKLFIEIGQMIPHPELLRTQRQNQLHLLHGLLVLFELAEDEPEPELRFDIIGRFRDGASQQGQCRLIGLFEQKQSDETLASLPASVIDLF